MSEDSDKKLFTTFGTTLVIFGVVVLVSLYGNHLIWQSIHNQVPASKQAEVALKATTPVYRVVMASASEESAADEDQQAASSGDSEELGADAGEKVFKAVCHTCHIPGAAGAPKVSDKDEWKKRLAKGIDTLYHHAMEGFNAMPPRGGHPDLSDAQVKAAVNYMLHRSGAKD